MLTHESCTLPQGWTSPVTVMGQLSSDELEIVYKTGMKPSEYLAYN